jgi:hypothetical protein
MKRAIIVVSTLLIGACAAVLIASAVRAQGPTQQTQSQAPPGLTLGPASAPASLARTSVLNIVSHEFGLGILRNPYTVDYGAFTDRNYRRMGRAGLTPVGTLNAWKVTITGLSEARPCSVVASHAGTCPPNITTLTVLVDDKAGTFLEAVGS